MRGDCEPVHSVKKNLRQRVDNFVNNIMFVMSLVLAVCFVLGFIGILLFKFWQLMSGTVPMVAKIEWAQALCFIVMMFLLFWVFTSSIDAGWKK